MSGALRLWTTLLLQVVWELQATESCACCKAVMELAPQLWRNVSTSHPGTKSQPQARSLKPLNRNVLMSVSTECHPTQTNRRLELLGKLVQETAL